MGRTAPHRISSIASIDAFVDEVLDYAIIGLDPGAHILSWNKGAQQITGYAADEIIGRHFSLFYPEESVRAGRPERALEIASTTGRIEQDACCRSEPLSRLLSGQPVFVPVVEESVLPEWTGDPDHVEMLRALGFRPCMMVPLVSCRVLIGALLCTNSASPLGLSDSGTELAGYYRVRPRRGGATETSPGRGRAPPPECGNQ
jgi:hypothetical protein